MYSLIFHTKKILSVAYKKITHSTWHFPLYIMRIYFIYIYPHIYIYVLFLIRTPVWKTTMIRRIAVRKTAFSRHHGGRIKGHLKPFEPHGCMMARGLRGPFNSAPNMPGSVSPTSLPLSMFHHNISS